MAEETTQTDNDDEGPWPVEPDGGPGDGAGPPGDGENEGPWPVEPDGGIGDGAGPPGDGEDEGPWPVEPDGGIGDGAGPPPGYDEGPWPVEPDGGIGDGARPLPIVVSAEKQDNGMITASDDAETFIFASDGGNTAIMGFDTTNDALDFSRFNDVSDIEDLIAASWNLTDVTTGVTTGIIISFGDQQYGYVEGIAVEDLSDLTILF